MATVVDFLLKHDNIGDNVNGSSSNYAGEVVEEETVTSYRPTVALVNPEPEQPEGKHFGRCFSCLSMFGTSKDDDSTIIVEDEFESRGRSWLGYEGVLGEILKSIVYGGLMEAIVSLGVVVSAAASDVTTVSIVSLALASVIGGVFILGHNLWDLQADCCKAGSSQEAKKAASDRYKELLGEVNYFPLHAVFAVLSFLVFGVVPLVVYRYVYHEIHDRDLTLVVVATVSLLCVALLAIMKAYINKCTVFGYFKTVVYYIILAMFVSGVSYIVGYLVTRWTKELGWFNPSSGGGTPCVPHATDPYLDAF